MSDDFTQQAEIAVDKGSDLLDAYWAGGSDWRADIDTVVFRITDYSFCTIGQTFPNDTFQRALDLIGCTDPVECGFLAPVGAPDEYWDALEDAWLEEFIR